MFIAVSMPKITLKVPPCLLTLDFIILFFEMPSDVTRHFRETRKYNVKCCYYGLLPSLSSKGDSGLMHTLLRALRDPSMGIPGQ